MEPLKQPLSNVQLEILKVFSHNLKNQELIELKDVIANFFAKRAINAANKVWDEQNWDNDKVNDLLNTKLRKTKK